VISQKDANLPQGNKSFRNANKTMIPRLIYYKHLGIIQNSLCLKLFVQIRLENDERVETALDRVYAILAGRVPKSVFTRHYLGQDMKAFGTIVFEIEERLEQPLLS